MYNIFQYLENKKGKPLPLEYKLLNNIPLNESDLYFNGSLNLFDSKITWLPDNLTVHGNLDISFSNITSLPDNLIVNGNLYLYYTNIKYLPDNLTVNGDLNCKRSALADNIKNDPSLLTKYSKQIKGKIYYV